MLCFDVTAGTVEGYSGKGGPHLQAPEPRCGGGGLTNFQNSAANSAPRPARMDEEGAYLGRIVLRVEKSIFAARAVVTSIKRLALAPASATGHDLVPVHPGLRHKIGPILNQLCIHTKDQFQSLLALLRRVVCRLQPQDRRPYEFLERRNVGQNSLSGPGGAIAVAE